VDVVNIVWGLTDADMAFVDIESHWAQACVMVLTRRRLLPWREERFEPERVLLGHELETWLDLIWPKRAEGEGLGAKEPVLRGEAIAQLVGRLRYVMPLMAEAVIGAYFEDGDGVKAQWQRPVAAATLAGLVVNYPDVRRLRPMAGITRAEMAAMVSQALGIQDGVPLGYVPWSLALDGWDEGVSMPFWRLRGNGLLVKQVQQQLQRFRLYPKGQKPDGRYGLGTQMGLIELSQGLGLTSHLVYEFNRDLAQVLLQGDPACFLLAQAQDRGRVYREYWQQEAGYSAAKLAFLDKGVESSPWQTLIGQYPQHILRKHANPVTVASGRQNRGQYRAQIVRAGMDDSANEQSYWQGFPRLGEIPRVNALGLSFLHPDIRQACVCVGQFGSGGKLQTAWLGRQPLVNVELWSATKIIPLMHLACQLNGQQISVDLDDLMIRRRGAKGGVSVYDLAVDMIDYRYEVGSSNALAAMFKLFSSPANLERWIKRVTGNQQLIFRGRYGEGEFMKAPEVWDSKLKRVLLRGTAGAHRGDNSLSTYDMTRLVAMLVWHAHLDGAHQLPGAQWNSLESIIRAMGSDSARYVDAAMDRLGLVEGIEEPVVISKLGFGRSRIRKRTELVYSGYVQFVDKRSCRDGGAPRWYSVAMTLVGASDRGGGDQEAKELDARMATEVTEIVRRLVLGQLVGETDRDTVV
jgi:S-layer homology domain